MQEHNTSLLAALEAAEARARQANGKASKPSAISHSPHPSSPSKGSMSPPFRPGGKQQQWQHHSPQPRSPLAGGKGRATSPRRASPQRGRQHADSELEQLRSQAAQLQQQRDELLAEVNVAKVDLVKAGQARDSAEQCMQLLVDKLKHQVKINEQLAGRQQAGAEAVAVAADAVSWGHQQEQQAALLERHREALQLLCAKHDKLKAKYEALKGKYSRQGLRYQALQQQQQQQQQAAEQGQLLALAQAQAQIITTPTSSPVTARASPALRAHPASRRHPSSAASPGPQPGALTPSRPTIPAAGAPSPRALAHAGLPWPRSPSPLMAQSSSGSLSKQGSGESTGAYAAELGYSTCASTADCPTCRNTRTIT
jgi:hypothetical protein